MPLYVNNDKSLFDALNHGNSLLLCYIYSIQEARPGLSTKKSLLLTKGYVLDSQHICTDFYSYCLKSTVSRCMYCLIWSLYILHKMLMYDRVFNNYVTWIIIYCYLYYD